MIYDTKRIDGFDYLADRILNKQVTVSHDEYAICFMLTALNSPN